MRVNMYKTNLGENIPFLSQPGDLGHGHGRGIQVWSKNEAGGKVGGASPGSTTDF